jgi:ribonuclease BN (tRNA processing enzyme)
VAITHFHLDHWGDLVPWTFGAMFGAGRGTPPPELWLPPGGLETLRSFGEPLAFGSMIEDVFRIREYEEATPFTAGGLEITPVRLHHFEVSTFGLRVSDGARTLAYSGDTAPSPALATLASGADLFLCEATLAEPEQGIRGHLTAGEAIDAYKSSGADRFVVIHRPDELPLPDGVERAHDGLELDV